MLPCLLFPPPPPGAMSTQISKWTRQKGFRKDFVDPTRPTHQPLRVFLSQADLGRLKDLAAVPGKPGMPGQATQTGKEGISTKPGKTGAPTQPHPHAHETHQRKGEAPKDPSSDVPQRRQRRGHRRKRRRGHQWHVEDREDAVVRRRIEALQRELDKLDIKVSLKMTHVEYNF